MSVSATTKALIEVTKVLTDKDKRKVLYYIIAIPFILIFLISSMFFYRSPDESEAFLLSVSELKAEKKISNQIDGDLIRCVYMLYTSEMSEDKAAVKKFVLDYFYKEDSKTVEVEGTHKVLSTKLFFTFDEIIERVKKEPFYFTSEKTEMLQYFMPYPQLEVDDNFVAPCNGGITSQFGARIHPITHKPTFHTGIDISGKWHQSISAVADGEVVNVSTVTSGYGNHVTIKHTVNSKTFYSFYAHLSCISVNVGQLVTKGQAIANEGGSKTDNNPGTSTGHHLHFELRENAEGDFLNPENIFKERK